jgi:hypothetical protein
MTKKMCFEMIVISLVILSLLFAFFQSRYEFSVLKTEKKKLVHVLKKQFYQNDYLGCLHRQDIGVVDTATNKTIKKPYRLLAAKDKAFPVDLKKIDPVLEQSQLTQKQALIQAGVKGDMSIIVPMPFQYQSNDTILISDCYHAEIYKLDKVNDKDLVLTEPLHTTFDIFPIVSRYKKSFIMLIMLFFMKVILIKPMH